MSEFSGPHFDAASVPADMEALPRPIRTERLVLRRLTEDDAEFVYRLQSEPPFRRYIGDRGVHSVEDGRKYILKGPAESYRRYHFGLLLVQLAASGEPIGMSGLVKRVALTDVDLGFAFLSEHGSKGYAYEAAVALLRHASDVVGLRRVVAITSLDNGNSMRLLGKLGFRFERRVRLVGDTEELNLFALSL